MPSENDNKLINLLDLKEAYDNSKHIQTVVSSPSASGTAVAFIDSISQNTNGVISPTKKTVAEATQSAAGLMSAVDKKKLDGIASGAQANSVTGIKGNAESSYRTGNVNLTSANIGAKAVQSAVSDPTASGTAIAFIDSLSQNAQGVISPTKKTVQSASQSAAGLMSAADKTKLDGIASGAQVNTVTGVKGNAEGSYRTGNVNLTPANIRAFGAGSVGAITDANDTSLYGSSFLQANACANLPTNISGVYYQVEFFGVCQMAFRYSSTGITETWGRYYANPSSVGWYPWVRIDKVTGVKGNAESSYRTGDVNLTPANIGAHPANTRLVLTNNTDYAGNTASSQPIVQIVDTNNFIRHQLYGLYGDNGGFYTYIAARKPNGSSPVSNQIAIGFDADGNGKYSLSYPAAFRDAIGATNTRIKGAAESSYRSGDVNLTPANIGASESFAMYNADYQEWETIFDRIVQIQLYRPHHIYIDSNVTRILTDKEGLSVVLIGTISRSYTTDTGTHNIRIFARNIGGNYIYNITITEATRSSRGTVIIHRFYGELI